VAARRARVRLILRTRKYRMRSLPVLVPYRYQKPSRSCDMATAVFLAYQQTIVQLLSEGRTYEEVSSYLTEQTGRSSGLSSRSLRRYCTTRGIWSGAPGSYCTHDCPKSWPQLWKKNDAWDISIPKKNPILIYTCSSYPSFVNPQRACAVRVTVVVLCVCVCVSTRYSGSMRNHK